MSQWKSKFADRGKKAEEAVSKALEAWAYGRSDREYNRMIDTRAAGRVVKAAAADFEFFCLDGFGLIEVKSTEHAYRLSRDKISQLPRLRKRALCGGVCLVLVHHSQLEQWRVVDAPTLATFGDTGSWDLTDWPLYESAQEALGSAHAIFRSLLQVQEKLVYCHYCRKHKSSEGFKVLRTLGSHTKRYRCPECQEVRTDGEARAKKDQHDKEIRRGEQATRVLLAKEAKATRRKAT